MMTPERFCFILFRMMRVRNMLWVAAVMIAGS